jgi:predicted aldo/keto reductase-like oxidoreductase
VNFISREAEERLVPLAVKHDVGLLGMKPFAGGTIRSATLAIKYLMQFKQVVPVPGIETVEEIEEIVRIVDGGEALTPEERAEIDRIHAETGDRFCRQCEYCMPCEQGVLIPALMYTPRLWGLWSRERILTWPYVTASVESIANCTRCGICETRCPYRLPVRDMLVECAEFHRRAIASGGEISNK